MPSAWSEDNDRGRPAGEPQITAPETALAKSKQQVSHAFKVCSSSSRSSNPPVDSYPWNKNNRFLIWNQEVTKCGYICCLIYRYKVIAWSPAHKHARDTMRDHQPLSNLCCLNLCFEQFTVNQSLQFTAAACTKKTFTKCQKGGGRQQLKQQIVSTEVEHDGGEYRQWIDRWV